MNKVRLRKLASVLENYATEKKKLVVPLDRFDMDHWFRHDYTEPKQRGCGTAACAVGFAMLHPWFQKQGLVPTNDVTLEPSADDACLNAAPKFEGTIYRAIEDFFDIDEEAKRHLFMPGSYEGLWVVRPLTVARRIREYVKTGVVPE